MSFTGKKCVVTGAASGIGNAAASFFAAQGAAVALVDVKKEAVVNAAGRLAEQYPEQQIAAYHCDVRDIEDIESTMEAIAKTFGDFDILINAAGVVHRNLLMEVDEQTWDFVCDINLKGAFFVCKEAMRHMSRGGKIINFSSLRSQQSDGKHMIYDITKAGVEALTRGLAVSGGEKQIIANAVSLAYIVTAMNAKQFDDAAKKQQLETLIPLKRMLEMDDVMSAISFLCSDSNKSINGQTICVDGGISAKSIM